MDQPTVIEYSTVFDLLLYLDKTPHTEFDHVILQTATDWIPQDASRLNKLYNNEHYKDKLLQIFPEDVLQEWSTSHSCPESETFHPSWPKRAMYSVDMFHRYLLPELKKIDNLIFIGINPWPEGWKGNVYAEGGLWGGCRLGRFCDGSFVSMSSKSQTPTKWRFSSNWNKLYSDSIEHVLEVQNWDDAEVKKYSVDKVHFTKEGHYRMYELVRDKLEYIHHRNFHACFNTNLSLEENIQLEKQIVANENIIRDITIGGDRPTYENDEFSWTKQLEEATTEIKKEYFDVLNKVVDKLPNLGDVMTDQYHLGRDWKVVFMYMHGQSCDVFRSYFPKTFEALEQINTLETAFFSILQPGKHIPPHTGQTTAVLRCHLPLEVPKDNENCWIRLEDKKYNWQTGKCWVFDDSRDHEVQNNTEDTRPILLLDFLRPTTNPEIPKQQIQWYKESDDFKSSFQRTKLWSEQFTELYL